METTSKTNADAIIHNYGGGALVIYAALSSGLPMPFHIAITEDLVDLLVDPDELDAWADWVEEPIATSEHNDQVREVRSDPLGFAVRVCAVGYPSQSKAA